MNKYKSTIDIVIKYVNISIIVLMVFGMIYCKNAKKESQTKKQTTEVKEGKQNREEPKLVYDDNGNVIERHAKSYRRTDESVRSVDSYYYKYDDKNNLIEETKESYTPEGELNYKNVNFYKYNDKNQKIELLFASYDMNDVRQRQAKTTIEYNEYGHPFKEQTFHEDGTTLRDVLIRETDEAGEILSEEYIHYNQDGSKKDHKKYYYTDYGLDRTEDLMEK